MSEENSIETRKQIFLGIIEVCTFIIGAVWNIVKLLGRFCTPSGVAGIGESAKKGFHKGSNL